MQNGLRTDERHLDAQADAEAEEGLVADPLRGAGGSGGVEGCEETGAEGHDERAEEHEGCIVAKEGCGDARYDGHEDQAEKERDAFDPRLDG